MLARESTATKMPWSKTNAHVVVPWNTLSANGARSRAEAAVPAPAAAIAVWAWSAAPNAPRAPSSRRLCSNSMLLKGLVVADVARAVMTRVATRSHTVVAAAAAAAARLPIVRPGLCGPTMPPSGSASLLTDPVVARRGRPVLRLVNEVRASVVLLGFSHSQHCGYTLHVHHFYRSFIIAVTAVRCEGVRMKGITCVQGSALPRARPRMGDRLNSCRSTVRVIGRPSIGCDRMTQPIVTEAWLGCSPTCTLLLNPTDARNQCVRSDC